MPEEQEPEGPEPEEQEKRPMTGAEFARAVEDFVNNPPQEVLDRMRKASQEHQQSRRPFRRPFRQPPFGPAISSPAGCTPGQAQI